MLVRSRRKSRKKKDEEGKGERNECVARLGACRGSARACVCVVVCYFGMFSPSFLTRPAFVLLYACVFLLSLSVWAYFPLLTRGFLLRDGSTSRVFFCSPPSMISFVLLVWFYFFFPFVVIVFAFLASYYLPWVSWKREREGFSSGSQAFGRQLFWGSLFFLPRLFLFYV